MSISDRIVSLLKLILFGIAALLLVSCSKETISADSNINKKISKFISYHQTLSLNKVAGDWDKVLIDSVYSFESDIEELGIEDADISQLPLNDEIVIGFINEDKLQTYAVIGDDEKDRDIIDYLDDYLYQNTHKTYPYGTEFIK